MRFKNTFWKVNKTADDMASKITSPEKRFNLMTN